MKNKKFNKRNLLSRIIALPFIACLILISHLIFSLKRIYHFCMYGGEYLNFEENEVQNILGIYNMLKEIKENGHNKTI